MANPNANNSREMAARAQTGKASKSQLTEENTQLRRKLETNARDTIIEDPLREDREEFIKRLQTKILEEDGVSLMPQDIFRFTAWERLGLVPQCKTKSGRELLLRSLDDVAKEEAKRIERNDALSREARDRDIRLEELAVRRLEAENAKARMESESETRRLRIELDLQRQATRNLEAEGAARLAQERGAQEASERDVRAEEAQGLAELEERELRRAAGLE